MSRVLVTGSADGLGRLAARRLVELGHDVVLHGRSEARAREARAAVPGARAALAGDLSRLPELRALAEQARAAGPFDAVIHNAGVYRGAGGETPEGLGPTFAVNVLAPYVLTARVPAARLVYLTSGMHTGGGAALAEPGADGAGLRRWSRSVSYSDSKLLVVALAFAVARRWPGVLANAVNPGWVPTKMGGAGAPDDLEEGAATQVWLAVGDDPGARVSGRYFFHRRSRPAHPAASDPAVQDRLIEVCRELSGVALPEQPSTEAAGAEA